MNDKIGVLLSADPFEGLSAFKKGVAKLYYSAGQGTGLSDLLKTILQFKSGDLEVANQIWNMVSIMGMVMLLIFFFIELSKMGIQAMSDGRIQQVASPFFKLVFGVGMLQFGGEIVGNLLGIGNNYVIKMIGTGTDPAIDTTMYVEMLKDKDITQGEAMMQVIPATFFWLASLLVSLVIVYQAISRKIEVVLRVGLTPIALGDIYNLENSTAIRYLKKLFALILWGFVMCAILQIGAQLGAENLVQLGKNEDNLGVGTMTMTAFLPLLLPLAEAGMVSASKQILFDVLGC